MRASNDTTPQLERALTLRDLVLFNLVAVIGITWVATAAKAGPSALMLWLLATIFFFIPQGLAVIQLSSSFPDEGGIYAWTKRLFGEGHGFVCGWCYWINNMLFIRRCFWGLPSPPPTSLAKAKAAWRRTG